MAQWIARKTSNLKVAGSSPARVALLHKCGGLAQSVECVVRNDEAPGSKPGFSTFAGERRRRVLRGAAAPSEVLCCAPIV